MTVARGFAIISSAALAFGAVGGGLGYALGRFAPGYYRGVFHLHNGPDGPDPVQLGLGLGLTQGLLAGLAVGSVVVLAVALSGRARPSKPAPDLD